MVTLHGRHWMIRRIMHSSATGTKRSASHGRRRGRRRGFAGANAGIISMRWTQFRRPFDAVWWRSSTLLHHFSFLHHFLLFLFLLQIDKMRVDRRRIAENRRLRLNRLQRRRVRRRTLLRRRASTRRSRRARRTVRVGTGVYATWTTIGSTSRTTRSRRSTGISSRLQRGDNGFHGRDQRRTAYFHLRPRFIQLLFFTAVFFRAVISSRHIPR